MLDWLLNLDSLTNHESLSTVVEEWITVESLDNLCSIVANIQADNNGTTTKSQIQMQSNLHLQLSIHFHGWHPQPITISRKPNSLSSPFSTLACLNPLTPSRTPPHTFQETEHSLSHIGAIMLAHDRLDGLGGLTSVIKWDAGDGVVQDMGLDDFVEEDAADKPEITIDGCGCTARVSPGFRGVLG